MLFWPEEGLRVATVPALESYSQNGNVIDGTFSGRVESRFEGVRKKRMRLGGAMLSSYGTVKKINALIAKKKYSGAIKLVRKELEANPGNKRIRQQLADLLPLVGRQDEAKQILSQMADEYVETGFLTKAIALFKKMQRIDPNDPYIAKRVTALVKRRNTSASFASTSPAVSRPAARAATVSPPVSEEGIEVAELDEEFEFAVSESKAPLSESEDTENHKLDSFINSPLFKSISEEELAAIVQGLTLKTFEAGEIVFTEGEPGQSLMVLANGNLRVYVRSRSGTNEQVRVLTEGAFFGEISLLSGKPRTATITCMTDVELLELDRPTLVEIAKKYPDVPNVLKEYYLKRANSPEEIKARTE